jgi:hypothetical protein
MFKKLTVSRQRRIWGKWKNGIYRHLYPGFTWETLHPAYDSSALPRRGVGVARTAIECAPWEPARETSNARSPGRRMLLGVRREARIEASSFNEGPVLLRVVTLFRDSARCLFPREGWRGCPQGRTAPLTPWPRGTCRKEEGCPHFLRLKSP